MNLLGKSNLGVLWGQTVAKNRPDAKAAVKVAMTKLRHLLGPAGCQRKNGHNHGFLIPMFNRKYIRLNPGPHFPASYL